MLGSSDRDIAEVEDGGEDPEQLDLLGGRESDDGEGVLKLKTKTWSGLTPRRINRL